MSEDRRGRSSQAFIHPFGPELNPPRIAAALVCASAEFATGANDERSVEMMILEGYIIMPGEAF